MIPILRDDTKVIGFLADALSCIVTEERNGIFELEMTYPSSSQLYPYLQIDKIIEAKPNDTSVNQKFRIYEVSTPLNGVVKVYAEHVSYLLNSMPLADIPRQKMNATTALSYILGRANRIIGSGQTFSYSPSDITSVKYFQIVNATARSAFGGMEGSMLDVYGGEFEFDNYTVRLYKNRGSDTGVIIAYGKNLTDVEMTVNMEGCYTGIYPFYYKDDTYLQLPEEKILIDNNSGIAQRLLLMDFTSFFETDEEVNVTTLRQKANTWLAENDINTPSCNLVVSFQNLWQSPEYQSFAALEKVSLCDVVTIRHLELGIDIKTKVIKTTFDTLAERYLKLELGASKSNFADTYAKSINDANNRITAVENYNTGLHSAITQEYLDAIENASNTITGNEGGYVVITPPTNPQEILVMNQPSIASATKLWRWNLSGLGYSKTGYNGTYKTAITMNGEIVADFITTGVLTANIIRAGVLAATDYSSYFNLETGYLVSSNVYITGGYISIGSGNYRTVIQNGSVEQYLNSASKIIGGLVPVGDGTNYWEALYCGSNYKGITLGSMSGSSYTCIAEFNQTEIKFNKTLYSTGSMVINGGLTTNENASDSFTAIKHYRTNAFTGSTEYTAQCAWGIGNPSGKWPSASFELRNYGSSTILARLDVFQSDGEAYICLRGTSGSSNSKLLELGAQLWWGGKMNATAYQVSSTEDIKEDIEEQTTVLDLFKSSKIYTYKLVDDYEDAKNELQDYIEENTSDRVNNLIVAGQSIKDKLQQAIENSDNFAKLERKNSIGFVIGRETPNEVISEDGKHVDLYSMSAITWRAVQELIPRIEELESTIALLQEES